MVSGMYHHAVKHTLQNYLFQQKFFIYQDVPNFLGLANKKMAKDVANKIT